MLNTNKKSLQKCKGFFCVKKHQLRSRKPSELSQKINAIKILSESINHEDLMSTVELIHEKPQYRKRFLLKVARETFETILVNDIAYFYSLNKITFARLFPSQKNEQVLDYSLDSLQEQINPNDFFRINRQYLININSINKIHQYFDNKLLIETKVRCGYNYWERQSCIV